MHACMHGEGVWGEDGYWHCTCMVLCSGRCMTAGREGLACASASACTERPPQTCRPDLLIYRGVWQRRPTFRRRQQSDNNTASCRRRSQIQVEKTWHRTIHHISIIRTRLCPPPIQSAFHTKVAEARVAKWTVSKKGGEIAISISSAQQEAIGMNCGSSCNLT